MLWNSNIYGYSVKDTLSVLAKLHFAMNLDTTEVSTIEDDYIKMMLRSGEFFA